MRRVRDEQIIDLYFERNEDAIKETDAVYGKYLGTVAFNILGDSGESDECLNDTYLRTWDAIPPARPSIFKAFLARITRNLALDRYKEKTAKKRGGGAVEESLDELAECVGDGGVGDSADIARVINALLGESKPRDRRIFVKRYFYQKSLSDISSEMEIGESLVKVTLHRMRERLRDMLVKEEIYL